MAKYNLIVARIEIPCRKLAIAIGSAFRRQRKTALCFLRRYSAETQRVRREISLAFVLQAKLSFLRLERILCKTNEVDLHITFSRLRALGQKLSRPFVARERPSRPEKWESRSNDRTRNAINEEVLPKGTLKAFLLQTNLDGRKAFLKKKIATTEQKIDRFVEELRNHLGVRRTSRETTKSPPGSTSEGSSITPLGSRLINGLKLNEK